MGRRNKPLATLSLDLDNQWSYMKIHGDEGWEGYPSYFDIFIPHVLSLLDEMDLKITFFIVAKDTENQENRKYLGMITAHGHEIGNHSYHHESWLQSYTPEETEKEVREAEEAIQKACGQVPRGFRGPGFSWSKELLHLLSQRGYTFDASTLPTFIGPFARIWYFWKSDLSREERRARKELFGKFSEGFRRLKPYYWNLGNGKRLLEIPVTTMPLFRIPFHLSYLVYLSGISMALMKIYLGMALLLCRITATPVSYLLHPLDLIGGDQVTQLAFFPGMSVPTERKVEVFRYVLGKLGKRFELVTLGSFAEMHTTAAARTI
jgi:hypothetical protein